MSAPRQELFIYYRVTESHEAALRQAACDMQAALRAAHPGLEARLLRRPKAQDHQHTWMEAYAMPHCSDAAAFDSLAAAIETAAQALRPWLAGERHAEKFIACAS